MYEEGRVCVQAGGSTGPKVKGLSANKKQVCAKPQVCGCLCCPNSLSTSASFGVFVMRSLTMMCMSVECTPKVGAW